MDCKTKTGLLLLIIGGCISLISNIVLATVDNVGIVLSGIGGIGGLCSFVGIILLILGRKEFGEKHRKFVIYAIILFILAIVIPGIIVGAVVFSYVSQGINGSMDSSLIQNIFLIIPVAAILGGLSYVFLLFELEDKTGRMVLLAAFAVTIITSVVLALSIGSAFEETLGSIDLKTASQEEISTITSEFSQKISNSSLYGIANGALMLIALIIPYKRINSGELVPIFSEKKSGSSNRVCPNCGQSIPFDANICPYCSKKFEDYL
jgi:hypothetical protein